MNALFKLIMAKRALGRLALIVAVRDFGAALTTVGWLMLVIGLELQKLAGKMKPAAAQE